MSLQAYAVETMREIVSGRLYEGRIPSFWNKDTCQLPTSVPLCHDSEKALPLVGKLITEDQVPTYKSWLATHQKQAEFFGFEKFEQHARALSPLYFRKPVLGEWLDDAQL